MLLKDSAFLNVGRDERDVAVRRALVVRIVSSPQFVKSPRLSEFLKYVCRLFEEDKLDQIKEQNIGTVVFGRSANYDPAIDTIVRSHAGRLRSRLEEYFLEQGAEEPVIVTIPKGSYVPIFKPRTLSERGVPSSIASRDASTPIPLASVGPPQSALSVDTPLPNDREVHKDTVLPQVTAVPEVAVGQDHTVRRLVVALAIATVTIVILVAVVIWQTHEPASWRENSLWSRLFSTRAPVLVINGDSGLVMLQNLTKQRISLASYMQGDFLDKYLATSEIPPSLTENLAARRYTSVADLLFDNRLQVMLRGDNNLVSFRYSRDVRLDDLKHGNAILLGTYESTPWVQLFEPSMNFYFQNDLASGVFSVINRSPQPGEEHRYDFSENDPTHTVYGVVAFRPNLSKTGDVLLLEGQTMAGTETACDFVFDDSYLSPFLRKIRSRDGAIPYFEILLRSNSLGGQSSHIQVLSYRVEKN